MQFKIIGFFLLFVSVNCFAQDVKSIKMDEKVKNVSMQLFYGKPTEVYIEGEQKTLLIFLNGSSIN